MGPPRASLITTDDKPAGGDTRLSRPSGSGIDLDAPRAPRPVRMSTADTLTPTSDEAAAAGIGIVGREHSYGPRRRPEPRLLRFHRSRARRPRARVSEPGRRQPCVPRAPSPRRGVRAHHRRRTAEPWLSRTGNPELRRPGDGPHGGVLARVLAPATAARPDRSFHPPSPSPTPRGRSRPSRRDGRDRGDTSGGTPRRVWRRPRRHPGPSGARAKPLTTPPPSLAPGFRSSLTLAESAAWPVDEAGALAIYGLSSSRLRNARVSGPGRSRTHDRGDRGTLDAHRRPPQHARAF